MENSQRGAAKVISMLWFKNSGTLVRQEDSQRFVKRICQEGGRRGLSQLFTRRPQPRPLGNRDKMPGPPLRGRTTNRYASRLLGLKQNSGLDVRSFDVWKLLLTLLTPTDRYCQS